MLTAIQSLLDRLLKHIDHFNALKLHFEGCRIKILSNHPEVLQSLNGYFNTFVEPSSGSEDIVIHALEMPAPQMSVAFIEKTPDPGKTKIKEEYCDIPPYRIVRKRLTGMIFIFGNRINIAIGDCLKNINQVVNFINNRYIEWKLCQGCLLGHAAGVVLNGKGLALAGFSGSGKSTLALHMMNRGASFVSNDRLMIELTQTGNSKHLVMHGVAKLPRINPGTIMNNPNLMKIMPQEDYLTYRSLSKEELWHVEHKYDAPIDECFGKGKFCLTSPMSALVILKRSPEEMTLSPIRIQERTDLLSAFIKPVGLFFMPSDRCQMPEPNQENYIRYLSHCRIWEIAGNIDFDQAADACISFLN